MKRYFGVKAEHQKDEILKNIIDFFIFQVKVPIMAKSKTLKTVYEKLLRKNSFGLKGIFLALLFVAVELVSVEGKLMNFMNQKIFKIRYLLAITLIVLSKSNRPQTFR